MSAVASAVGRGGRSSVSGQKAVVFGAYGFVGRYIVNRLARNGTQVVVPHRCDPYDIRHLRPTGDLGMIRPVFFEPRNDQDLDLLTRGADIVFNLMGQESGTSNWSLKDVHVDLAGRLAEISTKNNVGRFVQMSAVGAAEHAKSEFHRTKALGEQVVREKFPLATIVRSARIFGAEDKYSNRIASTHQRLPGWLPMPIPNGGHTMRVPVYVGDVAQALVKTMAYEDALGETYELVGPEHVSNREFIGMVSELIMRERFVGHVPHQLLTAVSPFVHPVSRFIMKSSALHTHVIEEQLVDEMPSDLKGLGDLGVLATPFRAVALRWLRMYRPPVFNLTAMPDADYKEQARM